MPASQVINAPEDYVAEMLEGFECVYRDLVSWNRVPSYVTRRVAAAPEKVRLLSGGGSGHEPLHAGFVGVGMLDAAVPGLVFSSPAPAQIHEATKAIRGNAGVVHIVKNYTGDVLNFEIAADLVRADGVALESVLIDDDLATHGTDDDGPGRRGTAAAVIVEKVAGAAAESGAPLADVVALGRRAASASRTLGVALTGCTHPGAAVPSFGLEPGECEFGVGIHGERGTERGPAPLARDLAARLVEPLTSSLGLRRGMSVLAIVNNLGATPTGEMHLLYRDVHRILQEAGIAVARALVGSYVTSLDMRGCSVTLTVADDVLVRLWDAPVATPALKW